MFYVLCMFNGINSICNVRFDSSMFRNPRQNSPKTILGRPQTTPEFGRLLFSMFRVGVGMICPQCSFRYLLSSNDEASKSIQKHHKCQKTATRCAITFTHQNRYLRSNILKMPALIWIGFSIKSANG